MNKFKIMKHKKLANFTTFKIGGEAEYFCQPRFVDEINYALKFARDNQLSVNVIGGGSNLLISDRGISGLVIHMGCLNQYEVTENEIKVYSGVTMDRLNKNAYHYGFTGLEFSSGLPGSIGGAVFMNARAYGGQMSDIVKSVYAIDHQGKEHLYQKKDLDFGYKQSLFMNRNDLIIVYVNLRLKKGEKKFIKKVMKDNYLDRKNKNQYRYPSAGCVFKNNHSKNIQCGQLIDSMGLKGLRVGGAEVSDFHGNFIINKKNAKASDIKKLIELVENKVRDEKNIELDREVKLMGF